MVSTGGFRTSALARGERTNAERAEYLDLFVVVIAREQTRRDLFCAHFTCPGHVCLGDISECKSGQ